MPTFRFQARDANGNPVSGHRDAPDADALRLELSRELCTDVIVESVLSQDKPRLRRIDGDDAAQLAARISELSQAGLPLPGGLRALAAELPGKALRRSMNELARRLEQGESLPQAVSSLGARLPDHFSPLVQAGLETGELGAALGAFADQMQLGRDMKRQVVLALVYPAFLLAVYAALVFFLSHFVVEVFAKIFADFGVNLPKLTVVFIQAATAVSSVRSWLLLLPFIVLLIWLAGRLFLDPVTRARIAAWIPLYGPLRRCIALSDFANLLALLLRSEVPLPRAAQLAALGTGNAELSGSASEVRERLEGGLGLSQAMSASPGFPRSFARVLRWAEGQGALPETLELTGKVFETEARARASMLGVAAAVITIVLVLWGCFFFVISMFLPLISLVSALS